MTERPAIPRPARLAMLETYSFRNRFTRTLAVGGAPTCRPTPPASPVAERDAPWPEERPWCIAMGAHRDPATPAQGPERYHERLSDRRRLPPSARHRRRRGDAVRRTHAMQAHLAGDRPNRPTAPTRKTSCSRTAPWHTTGDLKQVAAAPIARTGRPVRRSDQYRAIVHPGRRTVSSNS